MTKHTPASHHQREETDTWRHHVTADTTTTMAPVAAAARVKFVLPEKLPSDSGKLRRLWMDAIGKFKVGARTEREAAAEARMAYPQLYSAMQLAINLDSQAVAVRFKKT